MCLPEISHPGGLVGKATAVLLGRRGGRPAGLASGGRRAQPVSVTFGKVWINGRSSWNNGERWCCWSKVEENRAIPQRTGPGLGSAWANFPSFSTSHYLSGLYHPQEAHQAFPWERRLVLAQMWRNSTLRCGGTAPPKGQKGETVEINKRRSSFGLEERHARISLGISELYLVQEA